MSDVGGQPSWRKHLESRATRFSGKVQRSEGMRDDRFASCPPVCLLRRSVRADLREARWVDSRARRTTRATAAWRIDDGLFGDIQKLQPGSAQVAPTQQHHRSELKAQVQGGNREQAIALATRGKAGLAARQNRLCHRCAFARIAGESQNGEDDRPPDFADSAVPGRQTTLACLKAAISVASKPNSASTSSVCSPTSGGRAAILVGVRDRVTGWPTRRM